MKTLVILLNTCLGVAQFISSKTARTWEPVIEDTVPWLGVLRFKQYGSITSEPVDGAIGVTLISKGVALAYAADIILIKDDIRRKTTRVYFQKKKYNKWYTYVKDYIMHPEYDDYTVSTVALLMLQDSGYASLEPINWPKSHHVYFSSIYSFEMQIENNILKQVKNKMLNVNTRACSDFYVKEELNHRTLTPAHYHCFKDAARRDKCVCDSGITLATNSSGQWELLGISVHGPGCADPARFIDFYPYIDWIRFILRDPKKNRGQNYRRSDNVDNAENDWKERLFSSYEDYDQLIVRKINDTSLVLVPADDYAYGSCARGLHGNLIYRDYGTIKAHDSLKNPILTLGLYSVTVYDIKFTNVSCITASIEGDRAKWSYPEVEVQEGFKTDVDYLDIFVKTLQINKNRRTPKPKIIYLTDTYKNINEMGLQTTTFTFRFKFSGKCVISVAFYGGHFDVGTSPGDESTTTQRSKDHSKKANKTAKGSTTPNPLLPFKT